MAAMRNGVYDETHGARRTKQTAEKEQAQVQADPVSASLVAARTTRHTR